MLRRCDASSETAAPTSCSALLVLKQNHRRRPESAFSIIERRKNPDHAPIKMISGEGPALARSRVSVILRRRIRVEPFGCAIIPLCVNPRIEIPQVQVSALTFGPCAIARVDGKSVMIPAALPGEVLEIEIGSHKRDYALGRIVRVIQPAPERREPPCPYIARCGGCDWQHIRYDAQARLKAEVLVAEFRHTLGIELDPNGLVEPAPAEFSYRSRV